MKNKYEKPIIIVEEIDKVDVLLISEQTDNKHIGSEKIIHSFIIEDIL